jgi:membrane fusion protein, multidrug efflux system
VLATIDPRPFQIALDQAMGARVRDEASLTAARVTLQRYQVLLTQDSIARQDVDTQASLVGQLQGTVTMDRAAENTAKLNLGYARIVAPISGRVGLRPVDAGNYVSTGSANGIAVLTRMTPIDVVFSIPQDRIPELQARIAAGARLPVAAYDRTRTRKLDDGMFLTLDNAVDITTGTVKAKARYTNASGNLFPNQFVNAELLVRTIDGAVVVPVTALRYGPNGDFVYVVKDGNTVELRNVTRGEANVDMVAINTGLQAGEVVVTEGGDRLKEGARVQTSVDRPAGAASGAASGARGGRRGARGASAGYSGSAAGPAASEAGGAAPHPASAPTAALGAGPAASGPTLPLPTPEQRQRMLDAVKDDPEKLARRKQFLADLDRGDPAAVARWQQTVSQRRAGGEGAAR